MKVNCVNQGCGSGSGSVSGSGLNPDSVILWIRIRIGSPDPGSGSRGKKIKKFQWKNALFSYFLKFCTTNTTRYFLKQILMNNIGIFDLI
jgi:hypothetical protein